MGKRTNAAFIGLYLSEMNSPSNPLLSFFSCPYKGNKSPCDVASTESLDLLQGNIHTAKAIKKNPGLKAWRRWIYVKSHPGVLLSWRLFTAVHCAAPRCGYLQGQRDSAPRPRGAEDKSPRAWTEPWGVKTPLVDPTWHHLKKKKNMRVYSGWALYVEYDMYSYSNKI